MSVQRPEILAAAENDRAYRDDLTGLFNYRLLAELFEKGWQELAHDGALSLVILDLDLFKDVNDTYGHLTGNRVLEDTAELLRQRFRQDDVLIRYGGDEFVILCPGAVHEVAEQLAHRAREAMEAHEFCDRDSDETLDVEVSFSVGLASFPEDGSSGEKVLEAADRRLFEDKMSRRNARRSGRSQRERLVLPALGILVVILLAVINAMVERWSTEPVEVARSLPTESLRQEIIPMSTREAVLQAELERLRIQISNLSAAQPEQEIPPSAGDHDYEALLNILESRIHELEVELESTEEPSSEDMPLEDAVPDAVGARAGTRPPPDERPPDSVAETRAADPQQTEVAEMTAPRLIRVAPPLYPPVARRMRREAVIELRLVIDSEGRVQEAIAVGRTVGMGFEEAAQKAALKAVYEPGLRNGVAVTSETTLAVEFRLSSE